MKTPHHPVRAQALGMRAALHESAEAVLGGVLVMLLLMLGSGVRAAIAGERWTPAPPPVAAPGCYEQCARWCAGHFGPLLPGEREGCLRWLPASQVQSDEDAAAARRAMRGSLLRDLDGRPIVTAPP